MYIERREIHDLVILKMDQLNLDIVDIISKAYAKIIFIVDENSIFQGILTAGDYQRSMLETNGQEIKINKNSTYIYEHENMIENIKSTFIKYPRLRIIPILNSAKRMICAYTRKAYNDGEYIQLIRSFNEARNKKILDIADYLKMKKYKNIAIFGINDVSLEFYEAISQNSDIKVIGIYDNILNKAEYEYFVNYDTEVNYIESIDKYFTLHQIDCFLIIDPMEARKSKNYAKTYRLNNIVSIYSFLEEMIVYRNYLEILNIKKCISVKTVAIPSLIDMGYGDLIKKRNEIAYGDFSSQEEDCFKQCMVNRPSLIKQGNLIYRQNYKSMYINCKEGERLTLSQPDQYDYTVYLIGSCIVDGTFSQDKDTIASCLQKIVNTKCSSNIRIVAFGGKSGDIQHYFFNRLNTINLYENDIIILIDEKMNFWNIDLDMTNKFKEFYFKEDFFLDKNPIHCNYRGYELVAKEIYDNFITTLRDSKGMNSRNLVKPIKSTHRNEFEKNYEGGVELREYIKQLHTYKINKIGAIVMNCNPFTLGHRYLIEQALKKVKTLYIFVVEENLSQFSFENRMEMVKMGTKDLMNVQVIPSGKFIISTQTFSDYFCKENFSEERRIDTSTDVEVFAQNVVPALGIDMRFVGEEPFDPVTNQYNKSMREILPRYGVEVHEIARKKINDQIISASRVRKALSEHKFDIVKEMLPKSTWEYLLQNKLV